MTTSYSVKSVFDYFLKGLPEFYLLDKVKYSPGLVFEGLPDELIKNKDHETSDKLQDFMPRNWAVIYWDRETLNINTSLPRIHNIHAMNSEIQCNYKDGDKEKSLVIPFKMSTININAKIIVNNMNCAERLEEILLLRFRANDSFSADFGVLGNFNIGFTQFSVNSFEKLDHDVYGSLTAVNISFVMDFPIFDFTNDVRLILRINEFTYLTSELGVKTDIKDEITIVAKEYLDRIK